MTPRLAIEPPVRVGDAWIVAVSATTVHALAGFAAVLSKVPRAVVIVGPDAVEASLLDGSQASLERLYESVAGLRTVVSSLAAATMTHPGRCSARRGRRRGTRRSKRGSRSTRSRSRAG